MLLPAYSSYGFAPGFAFRRARISPSQRRKFEPSAHGLHPFRGLVRKIRNLEIAGLFCAIACMAFAAPAWAQAPSNAPALPSATANPAIVINAQPPAQQ